MCLSVGAQQMVWRKIHKGGRIRIGDASSFMKTIYIACTTMAITRQAIATMRFKDSSCSCLLSIEQKCLKVPIELLGKASYRYN